ncbi:MAG: prolyl oligopeptidase family serine peptidase [Proteobacteria bacterium]|nr:prolyl oligopeptidase family serine peptidase [Pseudomonadota bacterium]
MKTRSLALASVCILSLACGGADKPVVQPADAVAGDKTSALPAAAIRPVTTTYHGVQVTDPYQWLENGDDPEVKAWAAAQNQHARAHLDALPNLPAITEEVKQFLLNPSPGYSSPSFRAGKLFFLKYQPPKEQAMLVVFDDGTGFARERVILDPTELDDEGTLGIDWYAASPDGSKVALSMSKRGTERGDLYLYHTATGQRLADFIEHVQNGTAGGNVTWTPDSTGFYYTRYPRKGERPDADRDFYQQLWFHRVGTPAAQDRYELGRELPKIAEISANVRSSTGELLVTVQNGDGGDLAHYLRAPGGTWQQLSRFGDGIKGIFFGRPGDLFVLSKKDAPNGKILRLSGGSTDIARAKLIIDQRPQSITWTFWNNRKLLVSDSRIYIIYQAGGPTVLRVFDHNGKPMADPEQLPVASMGGLRSLAGDEVLFHQSSFLTPGGWYWLGAGTGGTRRVDTISRISRVDFSDAEVIREYATSRDGTKIPVSIIIGKDAPRDGSRPCIANGYGGYGSSIQPRYRPLTRIMLDRNTCFAIANLRGGGEFGEEWHRQGMLTNKQNVFDDFAAVLRHLVARGYTSANKLGIIGGSNGGLLMGATFTQNPQLVRAVVSLVGIYDMLRFETEPNGAFNTTEFGSVKNQAQFKALYSYSPYHNVKDNTAYPAILFTHGDNDPRVAPGQSRKMTARMQAANGSPSPILLRTSAKSGHGAGSLSEAISDIAHTYAFLLHYIDAFEAGPEAK